LYVDAAERLLAERLLAERLLAERLLADTAADGRATEPAEKRL
jgi:hypothetical protein